MHKSRLISLFLCLVLSGTVYAEENATYSVLDKPVASAVQDNETVVEFFSFYCPPCYAFSQDYGIDKAFLRGKNWSSIMPVFWESWERN